MPVLTLSDYRRILADCERIREGYPDPCTQQYMAITGQIQRLKSSIEYLEKKEAEK